MHTLFVVVGLIIIMVVFIKNIWDRFFPDMYSSASSKQKRKKSSGEVIDITDSWIDISDLKLTKREYLLTPKELSLFHTLDQLLSSQQFTVFPKVQLSELFQLSSETNNRIEIQRRLKERTVDFIICDESILKPLLMIFTTSQNDTRREQMTKDFGYRAAQSAGVNTLRIDIDSDPDSASLIKQLRQAGLM